MRTTVQDVQIGGFTIPKNTEVVPSISNVMLDEKTFENPFEFNVCRF
jgi:cytochrome P450